MCQEHGPPQCLPNNLKDRVDQKDDYPVVSRRSKGISIGVNLNPDRVCNFDCIYCQVDRTVQSETEKW